MSASEPQRQFALEVVKKLRDAGHEALWAGGCVRDQLLGLQPKDYDVATSALPDQVRELFGRRRTLAIGAAFGVITVRNRDVAPIEVATFRTDGKYVDGRRPESVEFTTAEHDAQRRDFTINGLFFDPVAQQVIDYVGGVADLKARVVRAIGDPHQRFAEDRLRMLRAVRFAATYEFELDGATLAAIYSMADAVLEVSGERIGAELRRILTHESRAYGVALLADSGLIRPLLPELWRHAAANDEPWEAALHRLYALQAPSFPAAVTALVFGMVDEGQLSAIAGRWRLSNKELDRAAWLLKRMPAILTANTLPWPQLQRMLAHPASTELVSLAAASLPADDPAMIRCRRELLRPPHELDPPPLLTGDDLIAEGFKSGRHFSALLEHLRDEQLEGRLGSREEAIA
ncbi:MAG TPA: CCA tRNA nucleotidyltransferase, partial [Lacipirellula sp.]